MKRRSGQSGRVRGVATKRDRSSGILSSRIFDKTPKKKGGRGKEVGTHVGPAEGGSLQCKQTQTPEASGSIWLQKGPKRASLALKDKVGNKLEEADDMVD